MDEIDPEDVGLRYRYHLHMKNLQANRVGLNSDKPFIPIPGLTEGNDWHLNDRTGEWHIPSEDLPDEIINPNMDYSQTFQDDDLVVKYCDNPPDTVNTPRVDQRIQSDTGANANITADITILEDVKWIQPVMCKSAKKDASIEVRAIGKYSIRGTPIRINMYFCPEADNTIISPTAIVRQNIKQFTGYQKFLRLDKNAGSIRLIAREGYSDINIPIFLDNDLSYHVHSHTTAQSSSDCTTCPHCPTVNRLSDAAKWELWHQRLVHPGTRVMEQQHQCSDGVPPLRGNAFWRCPSCMTGKLMTKKCGKHATLGSQTKRQQSEKQTSKEHSHTDSDDDDDWDEFLDELYLPDALPGQHFHIDFGFVRGSQFKVPTENGKGPTLTSIDGKNSYCLIADRATRFLWVYISNNKQPPIEPVQMVLRKFGSPHTHRTVRTDQDKSLGKSVEFAKMVKEENFTLELTGTDSSNQNSQAERPHRDLAQMMRCMLHSSELGPQFWSFALAHAVYVKNRLYHSKLRMTPFQAFTGRRPDLSRLRIFGSRIYARETGQRKAKLDHHTAEGIFVGFTATDKNIYYIDDATGTVRTGQHVIFDEAHMTVPARYAPLAAQALQRLGYHANESWVQDLNKETSQSTAQLRVKKMTDTAKIPTRGTEDSIGYDVYLDEPQVTIEPGQIQLLPTGISATPPSGTYIRIAPRSGLTVKKNLHTLAGVVDPDYRGNITVVMHNFGTEPVVFQRGDKIAQLILENAMITDVIEVDLLPPTQRSDKGFGSTDRKPPMDYPPAEEPITSDPEVPTPFKPPDSAPPKISSAEMAALTNDLHLVFRMPYNIGFSDSPLDNQTFRTVSTFGKDECLGFDLQTCNSFGLPKINDCKRSTPCARLPRWRSELRGAYITSVNNQPVSTIEEVKAQIRNARSQQLENIEIGFATIERTAMHPQMGIPQLYQDQLNIIAEHLWDLRHDPEWHHEVEEAIPCLEVMKKDTYQDLSEEDKQALKKALLASSVKKQRKLTRKLLQQRSDWKDWEDSEFKQLDQYKDQDTFGEPEPRPKGANLLNLLWCYLVKDDGRKKARCVCNGNKNRRGTVTLAETYAASLDQTASRIFWAATAINNFITIGADASNAFAEAPAPVAPLYVYVDEQFRQWYKTRYPNRQPIPPGYVLRVKKALQGHPESPRLWAQLIDKIIKELNLSACTHEPNLYYTDNYAETGKTVLFMKQVDDFCVSCEDRDTAKAVIQAINAKMTIDVKELGLISRFNGMDIEQTRHYIKLSNALYLNKIMKNHKWLDDDKPSATFPIPMRSDSAYLHTIEMAEPLEVNERIAYENELGFTYRQAIGEIIYALVTCRPDISFSAIKLSQYSAAPAKVHYDAVKDIYRYLKATKDEGIYYWRSQPRMDLPIGPAPICRNDANYDETTVPTRMQREENKLSAAVDSDHAGDVKHRKSVTGVIAKLAGGVVLYKTAFQQVLAHSSTEAEFVAACEAGKYILYLRSLLEEIGLRQEDATIIYEDNQGALLMANAQRPTKRTKHMDLKHFGLQEWVQRDLIILHRINTSDNYADAMTKPLARTLFHRHMNYILGKIMPEYAHKMMDIVVRRFYDKTVSASDKNLRFLSREGVTTAHIPIEWGQNDDALDLWRWSNSSPLVTL